MMILVIWWALDNLPNIATGLVIVDKMITITDPLSEYSPPPPPPPKKKKKKKNTWQSVIRIFIEEKDQAVDFWFVLD